LVEHLLRVGLQVVQLPFAEVVEIDQFVAAIIDALVAMNPVRSRIFIVMVVEGVAPILRFPALEDWNEACALHVGWHLDSGDIKEGFGKVQI